MELEWDEAKRSLTLTHRGLDFSDASIVFEGRHLTVEDDRFEYGETRYQTIGRLDGAWSWWPGFHAVRHDASFR